MKYKFLKEEIESTEHNIREAKNLGLQPTKAMAYIKQQKSELKRLILLKEKFTRDIKKTINFDNCHTFVEYLISEDPKLIEAIVNEYEAQIRFNTKER